MFSPPPIRLWPSAAPTRARTASRSHPAPVRTRWACRFERFDARQRLLQLLDPRRDACPGGVEKARHACTDLVIGPCQGTDLGHRQPQGA